MLRPTNYGPDGARPWAALYSSAGLPLVPVCWPRNSRECAWHTRQYRQPPGAEDVVRCRIGRTPLRGSLARDPLRTVADVEAFWRAHSPAGPAVALWAAGLVRLDLDGPAALGRAYDRGLPEPFVWVQTTRPEGGWHVYWPRQRHVPLARAVEVLPDGSRIELTTEGEAPLPPTLRPPFEWLRWIGPALGEVEPPDTPAWAADMLRRARDRKAERGKRAARPTGVVADPAYPRKDLSVKMRALLDLGPDAQPGRYPSL